MSGDRLAGARSGSPWRPVVVVVGAGIAGAGAALAAARSGGAVTLVDGGAGASTLSTGAVDRAPWDEPGGGPAPIPAPVLEVLTALGSHVLSESGARLLTTAGIERPADGHDAGLLDVRPRTRDLVGVVACRRPCWNAVSLARAWGAARRPLEAMIVRHVDEPWLPDADFAARHDDEGRLGWLAERLREALARAGETFGALVLPPSLGIERSRADRLSRLVGVPCGEAVGAPGGPPGLRFERARDRALTSAGVARVVGRATEIVPAGERWRVILDDPEAAAHVGVADAVIVATGGLVGGGLEYSPAESMMASALPPFARPSFRATLALPATVGVHGRPLDLPSTLFGATPESIAWPFVADGAMDRAGLLAGTDGVVRPGLFVAGEAMADRRRTWLDALLTGVAAGSAAVRAAISARAADPWLGGASPSRS